jgi:hypothetical protein
MHSSSRVSRRERGAARVALTHYSCERDEEGSRRDVRLGCSVANHQWVRL